MHTILIRGLAGLMLAAGFHAAAVAQTYPTKPIRMIVPFNPGGTSDTIARVLGQKMTEAWSQGVAALPSPAPLRHVGI